MSNVYTSENTASREHLFALANRLTDEQLSRPLETGWTAAGILAHLAFWDQRGVILLEKWRQEGIGPSPIDTHIVNEAMRGHCVALPPRAAAQMAIDCASAIDRAIEQLDPAMLAKVETDGKTVLLDRSRHRRAHLEEIEKALGLS